MSATTAVPRRPGTPLREFWSGYAKSHIAVVALIMLALILAVALFAPVISPQDPYDLKQLDIMDSKLAPGGKSGTGSIYVLGTDDHDTDDRRGELSVWI